MADSDTVEDLGELTIRLGEKDNVVTALTDIDAGKYSLEGNILVVLEKVSRGFKIATAPITKGEEVYKYNNPVGIAIRDIEPGRMVHVHNLKSAIK